MLNDCQNYPDTLFKKDKLSLEDFIRIVKRCSDKAMDLLEKLMEETDIRFCDKCGKAFVSGFNADGTYYCSDKCLYKDYLPEEWEALTDEHSEMFDEDYYWTVWDGNREAADAYNCAVLGKTECSLNHSDLIDTLESLGWVQTRGNENEQTFLKTGYPEIISILYTSMFPFVQIKTAHALSLFPISSCSIKRVGNLFDDKEVYLIADDPKKPITINMMIGVEEEE